MATKKPPFDHSKVLSWLRSALRSASRRYPPVFEALDRAKRPYKGSNPRQKVCYLCAQCKEEFNGKQVAVDHIIPAGSLSTWDDVMPFVKRLFCSVEGLQVLCHTCHDVKTLADKNGISLKEAELEKKVIEFKKLKKLEQETLLKSLKIDVTQFKKADERVDAFRSKLNIGEKNNG